MIGIRSRVGLGTTVVDTYMMGSDSYETLDELKENKRKGIPPVGAGKGAPDEFIGKGFPVRQGDLASPDIAGRPSQLDGLEGIVATQRRMRSQNAHFVAETDVVGEGESDGLGNAAGQKGAR